MIITKQHPHWKEWNSSTVWRYFGNIVKKMLQNPISIVLSNSIIWKCFLCYGHILEILLKYFGNKASVMWKRSSFYSAQENDALKHITNNTLFQKTKRKWLLGRNISNRKSKKTAFLPPLVTTYCPLALQREGTKRDVFSFSNS